MAPARTSQTLLTVVLVLCGFAPLSGAPVNTDTGVPVVGDPNLRLWLDASDLGTLWQDTAGTVAAADGVDVALWQDKSGNAKDVSNTDTNHRPTYAASIGNLNGNSALQFVGGASGDMLFRVNDLGISGNADRTVVTVWQTTGYTGQNHQHTFHMGNQSTNEAYGHSAARAGGEGSLISNHYWGAAFETSATAVIDTARLAVSSWDGDGGSGTNGLDSWWVDGAPSGASNRAALATGTNELKIGSRLNGGTAGNEGFTGDLAEVIVFDTVLTAAERNALGYYIQSKYGIAVQDAAVYPNVVFDDNFTAPDGTVLDGRDPIVGGAAWDQTSGINVTIAGGAISTVGGARVIVGTFTEDLKPAEVMTLTFDTPLLSSNSGYAGISLLADGAEVLFLGDVGDGTDWTIATSYAGGVEGTDKFSSTLTAGAGSAVFTYGYSTGFSTLSVDGNLLVTGYLPAGLAVDQLQIWNNNGGDIALNWINVTMVVPEPSTFILSAFGLLGLGLVGRRRRKR